MFSPHPRILTNPEDGLQVIHARFQNCSIVDFTCEKKLSISQLAHAALCSYRLLLLILIRIALMLSAWPSPQRDHIMSQAQFYAMDVEVPAISKSTLSPPTLC